MTRVGLLFFLCDDTRLPTWLRTVPHSGDMTFGRLHGRELNDCDGALRQKPTAPCPLGKGLSCVFSFFLEVLLTEIIVSALDLELVFVLFRARRGGSGASWGVGGDDTQNDWSVVGHHTPLRSTAGAVSPCSFHFPYASFLAWSVDPDG